MKNKNNSNNIKQISKKINTQPTVKNIKNRKTNLQDLTSQIEEDINKKKRNNRGLILLLIILFILITSFIVLHLMVPRINIIGDSKVEIPYNGIYIEEGATAKFLNKNLSNAIEVYSDIDTTKVGTYSVIYKVKGNLAKIEKKREVVVVDKIPPSITLTGDTEYFICPKAEYTEAGYIATDEYDGDITDKVKVDINKDKITYSVKDSSNNEFRVSRTINRVDKTPPTITLKGTANLYQNPTAVYKEPGYTASDNCSGDLTSKVIVSGTVTSGVKGTYIITYTVEDDYKNTVTVKRYVTVSDIVSPDSGTIKNGTIYLTFDDGPSSVTTGTILDILKEENIKATFFVTNNGPDYLIKRMYDEGHTIGLHTASHVYSNIYSSLNNYFSDLRIVSDRVKRITGQESRIVRLPGGSGNTISKHYSQGIMQAISNELFNRGYRYYDWNIDSQDAATAKTGQAVANNVISHLSKNKVNMILMHDIKTWTRDGIRSIIRYGKEQGYNFEGIDMDTYMIRHKIKN